VLSDGTVAVNSLTGSTGIFCDVKIPHGRTADLLTLYGSDSASQNITATFRSRQYNASSSTSIASVTSNNSSNTWSSSSFSHTIGNNFSAYFVEIFLPTPSGGSSLSTWNVEVRYDNPQW
jgi:hypothetical protein